jgi:hypothetical protein
MHRSSRVCPPLATWRVLALATVLAVVTAVVGVSPTIASASLAPHRPLRHGANGVPGSGLTLAQAPAGLRSAVRRALGAPAASAARVSQQAKLTASDAAKHDRFGWSVALSGTTAVVGADTKNSGTGAAYVFKRSGTKWTQQAKLTASDAAKHDNFGYSVAISGTTAVIGADARNSGTGAAYVFKRSGTKWTQQAELTASNGAAGDSFGVSVAITAATSTAVVGADTKNSSAGAAYVFTRSGSTWTQRAELTASDAAANSFFGFSVAIAGSTAVVGATGSNRTGAAYVFTGSGSTWTQQAKLTATRGIAGDEFGFSVALSGITAAVGAINNNAGAGAAYVFTRSGTIWTQQAKLTASDGAGSDFFGYSVSLSATAAVVGAPDNLGTGAAYIFTGSGSTWTQQAKLTTSGGGGSDFFGDSVTLSGTTAVVGAYGRESFTGAAYVFANV